MRLLCRCSSLTSSTISERSFWYALLFAACRKTCRPRSASPTCGRPASLPAWCSRLAIRSRISKHPGLQRRFHRRQRHVGLVVVVVVVVGVLDLCRRRRSSGSASLAFFLGPVLTFRFSTRRSPFSSSVTVAILASIANGRRSSQGRSRRAAGSLRSEVRRARW